jgi:multicomponent Na+:H+ antiporter subunit D
MITMYVFIEMLTLVTIPLVTHYGGHESMFAGRKYAAYTIGGASLGFMAVVLTTMYGMDGIFRYGGSIFDTYDPGMMQFAFVLGFIGFGAKAAVFPLYDWLPTASVAPTPVTALLHAVAVVNSGVFAVMRMTYYVFGADYLRGTAAQAICLSLAIFSLLFGAAQALRERHFKRRLACSTISNLSYMLFGILLMTPAGLEAGLLHMLFHSVIKMTLFLCAGAFMHATGKSYVFEVNGIGRKMPLTFALYTLSALSLVGVPGLCGFVSKLHLVMAGLEEASPMSVAGSAGLMIAAFLCAVYTLTISIRAFFPMEDKGLFDDKTVHEAHVFMLIPICFFSVVNVVLGLCPGLVTGLIGGIAQGLM